MTFMKAILTSMLGACLMAQSNKLTPILACNMKAINSTERPRYDALTRKIKSAVRHQRELSEGYAWELDGKTVSIPEVAEWMTMERRCCPFITLQLEAVGNGTEYVVKLLGPDGVKAFLVSEFGIAKN